MSGEQLDLVTGKPVKAPKPARSHVDRTPPEWQRRKGTDKCHACVDRVAVRDRQAGTMVAGAVNPAQVTHNRPGRPPVRLCVECARAAGYDAPDPSRKGER